MLQCNLISPAIGNARQRIGQKCQILRAYLRRITDIFICAMRQNAYTSPNHQQICRGTSFGNPALFPRNRNLDANCNLTEHQLVIVGRKPL
jgi:hypothetical protein